MKTIFLLEISTVNLWIVVCAIIIVFAIIVATRLQVKFTPNGLEFSLRKKKKSNELLVKGNRNKGFQDTSKNKDYDIQDNILKIEGDNNEMTQDSE